MSLWWFLPPLVLLAGALIASAQARGICRQRGRLEMGARRVGELQTAVVRVRSDAEELRARLQESPPRASR